MSTLRARARTALRRATGPSVPDPQTVELKKQLDRLRRLNRKLDRTATRLEKPSKRPQQSNPGPQQSKPERQLPADFDEQAKEIIWLVRPFTMTSPEKLFALITAVRHLVATGVEGDFVECGVWRGGSMHAVARTLSGLDRSDRELYLFDTFEGMTEPTERDVKASGHSAATLLERSDRTKHVWAVASIEDVKEGLAGLDYPAERFHLVKGPVEETIPGQAPEHIALLRLDTDWYESTRHELEHLYSRLVPGGVLIIDDYGTWQGSKEATDEFIAGLDNPPLMLRAGRGRIGLKPTV